MRLRGGRSWAAGFVVAALAASAAAATDFAVSSSGHNAKISAKAGGSPGGGLSISQDESGQVTISGTGGATVNGQAQVVLSADAKRKFTITCGAGGDVEFFDVAAASATCRISGGDAAFSSHGCTFGSLAVTTGDGADVIGVDGGRSAGSRSRRAAGTISSGSSGARSGR